MKPVIFAGDVPDHLMSESALSERNAKALEKLLKEASFELFVEVLRDDLKEATALQILTAARSLLSQPWKDNANPLPEGPLKPTHAEVASLVTRALKHLQKECTDQASAKHWNLWTYNEFSAVRDMRFNAVKFGCSEDLAKLGLGILRDGCMAYSHVMCDVVTAHVEHLHSIDPSKADDFEVAAIRSAPGYLPRRRAPWNSSSPHCEVVPNNKAFAQRALEVMSKSQEAVFINCCDYDWLSTDQVRRSMMSSPNEERSKRFTTATKTQLKQLFESLASRGDHNNHQTSLDCLLAVPAWKELAEDLGAIRAEYQAGPFLNDGSSVRVNWARLRPLLLVASRMPADKSAILRDDILIAGVQALAAAPPERTRDTASSLVYLASALADPARPNIALLRQLLLERDFLNKPGICPGGKAVLDGELGAEVDGYVRRRMKHLGMSHDDIAAYRSIFIDAGPRLHPPHRPTQGHHRPGTGPKSAATGRGD
jgi:hypothetical protein